MTKPTGRPRGRPRRDAITAGVQQTVDSAADVGAGYIMEVVAGRVKRPSWARIDAAKFCIEHKLGKPKTKIALPTDSQGRTIIPYSTLVILAERAGGEEAQKTLIPAKNGPEIFTSEVEGNFVDGNYEVRRAEEIKTMPEQQESLTNEYSGLTPD